MTVTIKLRGDSEDAGRNLVQNFREKTEGILKLSGSISEKVKEEEPKEGQPQSTVRKTIVLTWVLKDPLFGKNAIGTEAE